MITDMNTVNTQTKIPKHLEETYRLIKRELENATQKAKENAWKTKEEDKKFFSPEYWDWVEQNFRETIQAIEQEEKEVRAVIKALLQIAIERPELSTKISELLQSILSYVHKHFGYKMYKPYKVAESDIIEVEEVTGSNSVVSCKLLERVEHNVEVVEEWCAERAPYVTACHIKYRAVKRPALLITSFKCVPVHGPVTRNYEVYIFP